ncbi:MAG: cytochrome c [Acidimicrobiales bacterium]|jgi:cytochrome c oxidase subunit 2|nr:cytochrome c [Acidimicrobiales bacterium]
MRLARTPLLVALSAVPLGALAACSSDAPQRPSDPVLAQGYDVYQARCAACHGNEGEGGAGLNLQKVEERLTQEQHVEVVTNGRSSMPAYESVLSPEEIQAVVRYERESL